MTYYPPQFPKHLTYPKIPLHQFLIDTANSFPDKPAIHCLDRTITYQQLLQKSMAFANFLSHNGIVRGDRVMIALWNVPEFVISFYGILLAGAIAVTAHPLSQQAELVRLLSASGARAAIVDSDILPIIKAFPPDQQPDFVVEGGAANIDSIIESYKSATSTPVNDPSSPDDIAVLQYTGGTTGLPRGAMMLHRNLVANAIQNATWWSWTEDDIVMGVLTLGHTWGLCCCLNSVVYAGASVILIPRFEPREVIRQIEKHHASIIYGSATMFHRLCDELERGGGTVESLRLAKAGAMPVPIDLVDRWHRITGMPLTLGYGLTEASPETHNTPPGRSKPGSIGIPIFDTEAMIINPDNPEETLPIGDIGELCIRGPQVCPGYWNRPQETEEAFTNGWLRTGDLACQDEEGYYYLVERLKDLIKHRGYSVFPAELEQLLLTHPGVRECLVVGEPDPEAGEIPVAHIVPDPAHLTQPEELIRFCAARISPLKTIRKVIFHETLPRTPVGKGLRRLLCFSPKKYDA